MSESNPSSRRNQSSQLKQTYVPLSIREYMSTSFKAAPLKLAISILSRSPILRSCGGRILAEPLELRLRELYERTSRDEYGSKLLEREWSERRLRARSGYPYD